MVLAGFLVLTVTHPHRAFVYLHMALEVCAVLCQCPCWVTHNRVQLQLWGMWHPLLVPPGPVLICRTTPPPRIHTIKNKNKILRNKTRGSHRMSAVQKWFLYFSVFSQSALWPQDQNPPSSFSCGSWGAPHPCACSVSQGAGERQEGAAWELQRCKCRDHLWCFIFSHAAPFVSVI